MAAIVASRVKQAPPEAVERGVRAIESLLSIPDVPLSQRFELRLLKARCLRVLGRGSDALDDLRELTRMAEADEISQTQARSWLAFVLPNDPASLEEKVTLLRANVASRSPSRTDWVHADFNSLGVYLMLLGRIEEALAAFDETLALDLRDEFEGIVLSNKSAALLKRAETAQRRPAEVKDAIARIKDCLTSAPESDRTSRAAMHYNLGIAYLLLQGVEPTLEAAAAEFEAAVRDHPAEGDAVRAARYVEAQANALARICSKRPGPFNRSCRSAFSAADSGLSALSAHIDAQGGPRKAAWEERKLAMSMATHVSELSEFNACSDCVHRAVAAVELLEPLGCPPGTRWCIAALHAQSHGVLWLALKDAGLSCPQRLGLVEKAVAVADAALVTDLRENERTKFKADQEGLKALRTQLCAQCPTSCGGAP